MAELTFIPKLSNDLAMIRITYDRKLGGIKLDINGFKRGEEGLLVKIFQQIAKITSNPDFVNKWVMLTFQEQMKKGNLHG